MLPKAASKQAEPLSKIACEFGRFSSTNQAASSIRIFVEDMKPTTVPRLCRPQVQVSLSVSLHRFRHTITLPSSLFVFIAALPNHLVSPPTSRPAPPPAPKRSAPPSSKESLLPATTRMIEPTPSARSAAQCTCHYARTRGLSLS